MVLYDLLREQKKAKKQSRQERTESRERKLVGKEKSSDVTDVRMISIRHGQLGANAEQHEARKNIRAILKGRGLQFKRGEVSFKYRGGFYVAPHGFVQAVLWLSIALPYLRNGENLYIGYVLGDSIWSYWGQLRRMFDNSVLVLGLENVDLITPLFDTSKAGVVHRLRKARLLRATWTCEDPTKSGRACGWCGPCKRRALARYELKRWPKK